MSWGPNPGASARLSRSLLGTSSRSAGYGRPQPPPQRPKPAAKPQKLRKAVQTLQRDVDDQFALELQSQQTLEYLDGQVVALRKAFRVLSDALMEESDRVCGFVEQQAEAARQREASTRQSVAQVSQSTANSEKSTVQKLESISHLLYAVQQDVATVRREDLPTLTKRATDTDGRVQLLKTDFARLQLQHENQREFVDRESVQLSTLNQQVDHRHELVERELAAIRQAIQDHREVLEGHAADIEAGAEGTRDTQQIVEKMDRQQSDKLQALANQQVVNQESLSELRRWSKKQPGPDIVAHMLARLASVEQTLLQQQSQQSEMIVLIERQSARLDALARVFSEAHNLKVAMGGD